MKRNATILGSCKFAIDHHIVEIIAKDSELAGALKGIAQVLAERGTKFTKGKCAK